MVYRKGEYIPMRKRVYAITAILSLSLMLSACEKTDASTSTVLSETPIVSTETLTSTETSVSLETSEASAKTPSSDVESVKALLDGFIACTEKATVTEAGDVGNYYSFTAAMKAGESYTLTEIIDNLTVYMEQEGWGKAPTLGNITSDYIDCGVDGKPDLHVSIELPVEDIEPFVVDMIVVEKDGKLVIAFNGDSWTRSQTTVEANGYISSAGSAGAAVMAYDSAFVDGNGDYQFVVKGEDVSDVWAGDLYVGFATKEGGIIVDLAGQDTEDLMVGFVSFKEDPDSSDIYAILESKSGSEATAAFYEDGNPIKAAFEATGIKVITLNDFIALRQARLDELGYKEIQ